MIIVFGINTLPFSGVVIYLSVSLKNDHTDFNLPGGKVEHNETYIQTGIREVKEETGIDV